MMEKIIEYLMTTPYNPNRAVLEGMLGSDFTEEGKEKLFKYVFETSYNMNRAVLIGVLNNGSNPVAVVGTAVVGTSVVGSDQAA